MVAPASASRRQGPGCRRPGASPTASACADQLRQRVAESREDYVDLRQRFQQLRTVATQCGETSEAARHEKLRAAEVCSSMALGLIYEADDDPDADASSAQLGHARDLLDCAQGLTRRGTLGDERAERRPDVARCRAQVLSTQACLLRKIGKCHAALKCAKRASALCQKMLPNEGSASRLPGGAASEAVGDAGGATEAAVSALLSESALCLTCCKAREGATAASAALRLCRLMRAQRGAGQSGAECSADSAGSGGRDPLAPLEAMCHHNLGACLEALRNDRGALAGYRKAFELAYRTLGEAHPLAQRFRERFADAYVDAHQRRAVLRRQRLPGKGGLGASLLGQLPGTQPRCGPETGGAPIITNPPMNARLCSQYGLLGELRTPVGRSAASATRSWVGPSPSAAAPDRGARSPIRGGAPPRPSSAPPGGASPQ